MVYDPEGKCAMPNTRRTAGVCDGAAQELFSDPTDISLFYFAGHGHIEATGGYLLGTDARTGDDGLPLEELVQIANTSRSQSKIIVLDSCHSGIAGANLNNPAQSILSDGMTILTASDAHQYASEQKDAGLFTCLFIDALGGAASNLLGDITPGSVYAHIDQSLGEWAQRPIFKTNVRRFVSLRKVKPSLELQDLHQITSLFPRPDFDFQLDPTYEPEMNGRDTNMPMPLAANTKKFAILQKFNRVNLVVPVGVPHMWHAAMQNKSCKLTVFGQHYWNLVSTNCI